MEWNMMDPGSHGGDNNLGCFVEDVYVPSDECQEVLEEMVESLAREDPKLRNGRRKLFCDKVVEKDLVPLIMCCTDEDIVGPVLRVLANVTQPLDVFLQQGVALGTQCQREINGLVTAAKTRCTDLDFFKSLHNRMDIALTRTGGDTVLPPDSELLNHGLLLLRNLHHTGPEDNLSTETSITLQSMLSSFFLSEMDKLVMKMLNHPQRAEWVVSTVQLISLVFKDYAGVLLETDMTEEDDKDDDVRSDCDSLCDVLQYLPCPTSHRLSHTFNAQLQIHGDSSDEAKLLRDDPRDSAQKEERKNERNAKEGGPSGDQGETGNSRPAAQDDFSKVKDSGQTTSADGNNSLENHTVSTMSDHNNDKTDIGKNLSNAGGIGKTPMMAVRGQSADSGLSGSTDSGSQGRSVSPANSQGRSVSPADSQGSSVSPAGSLEGSVSPTGSQAKEGDSGFDGFAAMVWESLDREEEKENEVLSDLSSGSCLMDGDIILAYLRKFANDIVSCGLSNLVRCLMKALMSCYEGVLDDSFFMWTVGFFLSYARHSHMEFGLYRDLLNLDVFGFLVYQGYRNCEILASQRPPQEVNPLVKYRLHLIVCTLNQLFQVILNHGEEAGENADYINTLQRCLAQMSDLQHLFVLLLRWHQVGSGESIYLCDLVHTNHTFLLLLEEWVSRRYLPASFTLLGHINKYATTDVMQKYGSLLEDYTNNKEGLNIAVMTMMYHVAGNCNRVHVLMQLPILRMLSEIWGDTTCTKFVEFNDLIEFVLESFMGQAFQDPVACAEKLFDTSATSGQAEAQKVLSQEEEDLVFAWTTDLEDSVSMVDEIMTRLHSHGSRATRQQVMLHLLQNGWLQEKQMKTMSDEIKELQGADNKERVSAELSALPQDKLIPFLVEKLKNNGFDTQLSWLQTQLMEAAYVRLGVHHVKYRVHVEEPLARFYALQDKSIPLVMVGEAEEQAVREPYFTALLQCLGLFPADLCPRSCVVCRVPHFLSPAQLMLKAQQLGDIPMGEMKFDLNKVQGELSFAEFIPLFKDDNSGNDNGKMDQDMDVRPVDQSHLWLNAVNYMNQTREATA